MRVCRSPELIAAYHGLRRLRVPRHPPHAFARLTTYNRVKQSTRDLSRVTILKKLQKVSQCRFRIHDLPHFSCQKAVDARAPEAVPRALTSTREIKFGNGCRDE